MNKLIYSAKGWVLCTCNVCDFLNYVEPHGTTALCKRCGVWTEHSNIPYQYRDITGSRLLKRPPEDRPERAGKVKAQ